MPDFLTFLRPRITQILKGFKLNSEEEVAEYIPVMEESKEEEEKSRDVFNAHGYFDQLTVNDYMPG